MRASRIKSIRMKKTGTTHWTKDYGRKELQDVYRHGDGWSSWEGPIRWLQQHPRGDAVLDPDEVALLKEDLRELERKHMRFTKDAARAFLLIRKNREKH